MDWDLEALTEKWQSAWWDANLQRSVGAGEAQLAGDPEPEKPSYFLHFAYPGISGYLHVGHMRGFTYGDVFTRYKRMTGFNVVYPAGFHASGIPAVAFAKDVERGEKTEYLLQNGYDESKDGPISNLEDPKAVVDYFARVYTDDYWKKFGFLIDERRNCTTIDDGYQRFIQWQFRRLNDKGWLIQKPHYAPFCPVAGPVAVDKSETDIKQGGSAEIQEFVALRFTVPTGDLVDTDDNFDTITLPCATLRPETIFGVTNVWVHPDHEYELVRVWLDGAVGDDDGSEVWLVSKQGRRKLEWQFERAEALELTVPGSALVGLTATAPVTEAKVPIVQGTFVDPDIATGVVMSVPGHAPFDWAAYNDAGLLEKLGEPPQIVKIEGYDDLPARVACQKHNVTSQSSPGLEAATEEVYSDEFNKGVLTEACGPYAGKRIKVVKDELREAFVAEDCGRLIRQFTEPVISRAGELVDIKRIPDQDFIHYADPEWTAKAKAHAAEMMIVPQRYKDDVSNVMDWFGDRACVRRGAWLGTPFPFKQDWIIEPIADSTFYPWFYLVTPYLESGKLTVDDLSDAFFDHIFNDGPAPDLDANLLSAICRDVRYWGPVDVNLGGKEHQTVHFPVYIMNMVGLMDDPKLWPKGIFVNWWVTQKAGAKISKSKGGAEPIPGAMHKYGVDPMRLYYCHVGSPHVDIEWDPDIVMSYRQHVLRLGRIADDLLEVAGEPGAMDAWLESRFAQHVAVAKEAYEAYDLRGATGELVYAVPESLRWYQRRGGANAKLLQSVLRDWAAALCPIVPHMAEEMWSRAGGNGLASAADFPTPGIVDEASLAGEQYVRSTLEDMHTVAKLAGSATKIQLFTAPSWKQQLAAQAAQMSQGGRFPMGEFMGKVMADPEMRNRGKAVQQFCGQLAKQANAWSAGDRAILSGSLSELDLLGAAAPFFGAELGAEVTVYDENGPDNPKKAVAAPLKPGIAME